MSQTVFGIATIVSQARRIVERLQAEGFTADEIFVVQPDSSATADFGPVPCTVASADVFRGGTQRLFAGIGALAVPGAGSFIAAGQFMAFLGRTALGATSVGVLSSLIGRDIPESDARRYEEKLLKGNYLISVLAETDTEAGLAQEIFDEEAAVEREHNPLTSGV